MKIIENGTVTSPKGYLGAGEHVGIKKAKKDLALIYSKVDAKAVGTFTQNIVKAAPVLWDKMIIMIMLESLLLIVGSQMLVLAMKV